MKFASTVFVQKMGFNGGLKKLYFRLEMRIVA